MNFQGWAGQPIDYIDICKLWHGGCFVFIDLVWMVVMDGRGRREEETVPLGDDRKKHRQQGLRNQEPR
jgi:hypothetical protein